MKKIFLFGASAIMMLLTACGGGHYDQNVVDKIINKKNFTEKDYTIMVEQLGYALDDVEGAKDLNKWEKENEQEAMSMATMYMALYICSEDEPNFPETLKKDVKSLSARFEAIGEKQRVSLED